MIRFRKASLEDLKLLKYWDTKQHVIDCDPDEDWDWENELRVDPEWREQLLAEIDGRPLGFVQIIDPFLEETHYWGEVDAKMRAIDIWIGEEEDLNKGYGSQMMINAIERCFASNDVKGILIDPLKSNVRAHRFYERLGFEFQEERDFDGSICYVYLLERSKYFKRKEEIR